MKKYIHIKSGIIAEETDGIVYYYKKDGRNYAAPAELIENSNDWQLKKDYEITAFRDENGDLWPLQKDGKYKCGYNHDDLETCGIDSILIDSDSSFCIQKRNIEIFSVLREDGIEFKIEDRINYGYGNFVIKKFEIFKDYMCVIFSADMRISISDITPAKKVILTTEDGFEIENENHILYYVSKNLSLNNKYVRDYRPTHEGKYFYSHKNACDYISQNKPKYSENQIREAFKYSLGMIHSDGETLIHKLNEKK